MTDPTPAPKPRKPRKPADEAHATLRQSRSRLAGNQLRVSLSEGVTQEIMAVRDEFQQSGQSPAIVDRAVDAAIDFALAGNVKRHAVATLKASLIGFLDDQPARGPLTTSPPDRGRTELDSGGGA